MSIKLSSTSYGKSAIRVMKLTKHADWHEIKEVDVRTLFEGEFEEAHTIGDNSNVLPTDTQKNTVFALAKNHSLNTIEEFGIYLAKHFHDNNPQIHKVRVELSQKQWVQISADGKAHPQAYQRGGNEKWNAVIELTADSLKVQSGISDLLILKTTDSGFSNFKRDQYTTLKDTEDRIFATSLTTLWDYNSNDLDFAKTREDIQQHLLSSFANHKSLSVQHTLYDMGKRVLNNVEQVNKIDIDMPNKHHLLVNLSPFELANDNEIFVVTEDPYGEIKGTLERK
jgi:urate oxidase